MKTFIFITCYIGIGSIFSLISELGYFLLKNANCMPSEVLFDEKAPIKTRLKIATSWPMFCVVILLNGIRERK